MNHVGVALSPFETSIDAPYHVTVSSTWEPVLDLWTQMATRGAALAFQQRDWLEPWRRTIGQRGEIELLAVTVRTGDGRPIVALPLVRETRRLRRIGFADGGVADYNAPILSPEAPQDPQDAIRLWRAVRRALPAADVIRLERMPRRIGRLANPFALLPGARPAAGDGLALDLPDGYDAWRHGLPRRYRKELGRCARLFDALPQAAFRVVTSDRPRVFAALERLQRERIAALGLPYALDEPDTKAFYHHLAARDDGSGILTALVCGEEVVAALFGLRHGSTFIMLRIGASAVFSRMSPARDLIVRTMELLDREGVTTFDFGLGDYAYKRRLGGLPHGLVDLVAARSPRGLVEATELRLRASLRRAPQLRAAAHRVRSVIRPRARADADNL